MFIDLEGLQDIQKQIKNPETDAESAGNVLKQALANSDSSDFKYSGEITSIVSKTKTHIIDILEAADKKLGIVINDFRNADIKNKKLMDNVNSDKADLNLIKIMANDNKTQNEKNNQLKQNKDGENKLKKGTLTEEQAKKVLVDGIEGGGIKPKSQKPSKKPTKVVVDEPPKEKAKNFTVSSSTNPKKASGDGYSRIITLGGKTFKLYKQYGGSFGKLHFNSLSNTQSGGTLSSMGCGPTAISIILSGLGINKNPYQVGQLLMKNKKPSSLASMQKEVSSLGLNAVEHSYSSNYNNTYSQMKAALEKGHQIVLYVGKGASKSNWWNFTHSGYHFISILGIDSKNNKVFVGNPGVSSGWFDLSTVVNARGDAIKSMRGWLEIYK